MIDKTKIALLHIAKARLGLSDGAYRDCLRHVAGVASSTELDEHGFEVLMRHFTRRGFVSDYRARGFGERPGMASFKQVNLIRRLWAEATDDEGDDLTLGRWMERRFGVAALRFADQRQAQKIIAALKNWTRRKREKAAEQGEAQPVA